jgi:uncharacterized membrane protein
MAVVVAVSVGGLILAHVAMSRSESPVAGMVVALVPVAVAVAAIARRMRHPLLLVVPVAAAVTAAWIERASFERHFADVYFVEHAGMMLAMAIVFGRTLLPGEEPLCTRFARLVHGSIDERRAAYTRKLTATWTAFFLAIVSASCLLYFTDAREAWSLLANILTPLLVVTLFVVEYAVRRRALPDEEPVGILAAVHAFRRHMAGSEAPR